MLQGDVRVHLLVGLLRKGRLLDLHLLFAHDEMRWGVTERASLRRSGVTERRTPSSSLFERANRSKQVMVSSLPAQRKAPEVNFLRRPNAIHSGAAPEARGCLSGNAHQASVLNASFRDPPGAAR